jgi:collagenase-like PrtC family protease
MTNTTQKLTPKLPPRLSLGPILYYWSRETIFDFYEKIANTAIDIVYLGETVCSKRRIMQEKDWLAIAKQLNNSGKEVVVSTLTLLEASSELSKLRRICESTYKDTEYVIEANDMAAVNMLSGKQQFVTGPAINIYNSQTLNVLAQQGLKRWVLPVELSMQTLSDIISQSPDNIETEIFAYGRLPLAYSARCFTARSHNLPKDDCQFRCLDDPDGLLLSTREHDPFLVLNGIQTQSAKTCNLINGIDDIIKLGVDVLRISPQSKHTERIINIFDECLHGKQTTEDAEQALIPLMPVGGCNGYWYGGVGMENVQQHINDHREYT